MTWRKTTFRDGSLTVEDLVGGSTVRVSYPDGSVIVGKLTVNSVVRSGGGITMVRITTPHSGDTYMEVSNADVEVWVASAVDNPRDVVTAVVEGALDRALTLGASALHTVVDALMAAGYVPTEPLDQEA